MTLPIKELVALNWFRFGRTECPLSDKLFEAHAVQPIEKVIGLYYSVLKLFVWKEMRSTSKTQKNRPKQHLAMSRRLSRKDPGRQADKFGRRQGYGSIENRDSRDFEFGGRYNQPPHSPGQKKKA
jgi:hypothetical protein